MLTQPHECGPDGNMKSAPQYICELAVWGQRLEARVAELEERLQAQLIQESKDAAKLTEFLDRIHELERNQPGIGDGDIRHALAERDRYRAALERIVDDFPPNSADYLSAWGRCRKCAHAALRPETVTVHLEEPCAMKSKT